MISNPSRLNSHHKFLILDASALINLLGSGRAADILRVIARNIVIEESVRDEVRRDPFTGKSGRASLDTLESLGLLRYVSLSDIAYRQFLDLTGATPPNDLDDGEAATIAYAEEYRAVPILDEKKATRIALHRSGAKHVLGTLDLLSSDLLLSAFSKGEVSDIVFRALSMARMRVPHHFIPWVSDLIGPERIARCPSISSHLRTARPGGA